MSLDGTSTDYAKYKDTFANDAAFLTAFDKGVNVFLLYRAILMLLVSFFHCKHYCYGGYLQKLELFTQLYSFHTIHMLAQNPEDIKIQDFGSIGCQDI